jgi:hypothetical protein
VGIGGWIVVGVLVLLGLAIPNSAAQAVWFTCILFWVVIGNILKDRDK